MKHILFLIAGTVLLGCHHREINRYNTLASLPDTLLLKPQEWKVITSGINKEDSTMYTLYGNDPAVSSARSGEKSYPAGALLSLVTWRQQPDGHWFGAIIPGEVMSVEQVLYPAGDISPVYTKYTGKALVKSSVSAEYSSKRIAGIVQQRAAVMP
jgi:hypothetical protein